MCDKTLTIRKPQNTSMLKDKIKGLGEIIILVNDIQKMKAFYQEVIGLNILAQKEHFAFFKLAEGHKGHPQILGLFDNSMPNGFGEFREEAKIQNSSLHHFALEIKLDDYDEILKSLKANDIELETKVFNWVQWKSIYLRDPEKNVIELVCFDPDIEKK